ncbi:methionine synthase I [Rhodobacterales bacterium HKCCE3408]|nr:methionine synthase I [Rhodobacterales bacterium HKCCE3408]
MGLIDRIFGGADATRALGRTVTGVAEVFVPNATRRMEISAEMQRAAMDALASEFVSIRPGLFDRLVNGLNRLPRPALAFGTIGLFVYAMIDPVAFAGRMQGPNAVPEALWWLLGAIVSFYFGARELYYFRGSGGTGSPLTNATPEQPEAGENAAISAWRRSHVIRDDD